ncbi:hypothetical protein [Bacteroides acidifaciens]|uniref:hypothetical protein n=1 Tax=Bacteroides acidifaciens TaxID=85831 RepID=UPI0025ADCB63|nr:hypothetical protein [Bacteroides acidifaciens]
MYGQIISFLFVLLIIYYAVMIFLDIQKAKAEKAAELDRNSEEDIDISDEASTFQPVLITRDEPKKDEPGESTDDSKSQPETHQEVEENHSEESNPEEEPKHEEKEEPRKVYIHNPDAMPKQQTTPEPIAPQEPQKPFRGPQYREATMTGGYDIEAILDHVNQVAESGVGPLGSVIYKARNSG